MADEQLEIPHDSRVEIPSESRHSRSSSYVRIECSVIGCEMIEIAFIEQIFGADADLNTFDYFRPRHEIN